MSGHESPPTPLLRVTQIWFFFNMILVGSAGIQLYILSNRTADFFAWTIRAPISAAFLGAGYFASLLYLLLATRTREWQRVRLLWIMILTLTAFTAMITLRDIDQFHIAKGPPFAQFAAWAWLAVYLTVPWISLVIILIQERAGGSRDYVIRYPLTPLTRAVFLTTAIGFTLLGMALIVVPAAVAAVWPWPIPQLPAGAIAAWLLTAAAASWWILREGDWRRARFGAFTYIGFYILQIGAAIRFADAFAGDLRTWVYIGIVIGALILISALTWSQELLMIKAEERPTTSG